LIGRAVGAESTGAIRPSISHLAGEESLPGTHRGSANVTLATGSPMALLGIEAPSFVGVQSAAARTSGLSANRAVLGIGADCAAGCDPNRIKETRAVRVRRI